MIIDLESIVTVGGSLLAFGILCFIAVSGFKQNSKKHGGGKSEGK